MVAATALVVVFAGRLGGRDAAAGTSVAVLIGSVPILLMSAFNNAWAPMVYRAQADERPRLIASTSVAMSTAAGALAIGVSLLAPVGLAILAPQSFGTSSALVTVVVIASAAPFMVPYLARIHLIFVRGDTRALAVATPVAVALSHLGALAAYGSLGAGNMWTLALALPVFYAIQAFFAHWMTRGDATDGLSLAIPWAIAGFAAAASCVTLLLPDAVSIRVVVAVSLVVLAVPITLAVQRRRGR
jgi:O-antigen/teichoic acid export membrane protein